MSTIWRINKPKVCLRLRLITENWGLDNSSYHANTEFNNCFIIYLKKIRILSAPVIRILSAPVCWILQNNNKLFCSLNKISYVLFFRYTSNSCQGLCLFFCFLFRLFFKEFLHKIVRKAGAIMFLFVLCFYFITSTF